MGLFLHNPGTFTTINTKDGLDVGGMTFDLVKNGSKFMKLLSVTTYNNKLYKEYAHRFESTYNWEFPYTVYNEDDGMMDAIPECKAFVERNKNRFEGKDFVKDYNI